MYQLKLNLQKNLTVLYVTFKSEKLFFFKSMTSVYLKFRSINLVSTFPKTDPRNPLLFYLYAHIVYCILSDEKCNFLRLNKLGPI
jgi:chloramphenicol O-acetyltransferase